MGLWTGREWDVDDVRWGVTGCSAPNCEESAELLWDGEPFCIDCADLLLERLAALEFNPRANEFLPTMFT